MGNMEDMHAALMHDSAFCDTLYPRTTIADNSTKISYNVFSFNGVIVLGNKISKFNHSCNANAFLTAADRVNDDYIYGVWIIAHVKTGEEVTLDYTSGGNAELHDDNKEKHNVKCDCTYMGKKGGVAVSKQQKKARKFAKKIRFTTDPLVNS